MKSTLITFGSNYTQLTLPVGQEIRLNIGYQTLIEQYIRSTLPTPYETENIIMIIEDEIHRIHRQLPVITKLTSTDPALNTMAHYLQCDEMITTDQIEFLFNQVADRINGSPRAVDLPNSLPFMMILIILREVLHHLHITEIEVIKKPNN